MSAETLRSAAEVLRERATEANAWHDPENEEPWFTVPDEKSIRTKWVTFAEAYDVEAPYIATMHPGVGLALADLLDAERRHIDSHDCEARCEPDGCERSLAALSVARLILGGAS